MKMIACFVFTALFLLPTTGAQAASPFKKSLTKKTGKYISEGVIIGGRVGRGYTLLNVRRSFSKKKKVERVVLDIGDLKGKPILGEVNYFHVSVDRDLSRVVVDLSQVSRSGVDQAKLLKMFRKSPMVKTAEITYDPEDVSTNLILKMKRPTNVEVFQLSEPNAPGRIVIDMKPAKTKKRRKG